MIQAILELFTTEEKVTAMLESPVIEFIFMTLFLLFIITLFVHFTIYMKIRNIRHYIQSNENLDVEPLLSIKRQFETRQQRESINLENFVQEKISSWRIFQIPIVNLIKMVQMTISIFILLGVLGTFIGLTISLGSIETSSDQLVENVAGVLSGIDVAFYTSIVGMGLSLIMTVLVRIFNTEFLLTDVMIHIESLLEGYERHGTAQMIDIAENIHQAVIHLQTTNETSLQSIVKAFDGFKDYTSELQQSAQNLALFNHELADNLIEFQTLFHQMKEVTHDFSVGTKQLNEKFQSLFTYFQQNDRKNERVVTTIEQIANHNKKIQEVQLESYTAFEISVKELQDFTEAVLQEQQSMHNTFTERTKGVEQSVEVLSEHEQNLNDIFSDNLIPKMNEWVNEIGQTSKTFRGIGTQMEVLPKALQLINETQSEHKRLLQDRFSELKTFNETFHDHINEHANSSVHLDQQIREVGKEFNEIANKNQQVIQEINRSLDGMKQTFTTRDQQLDSNVTMVRDTLTHYSQSIEGILGQKLDQLMQRIDQQMYHTNEQMNRTWTEMRQVVDEVNQHNVRTNQQLLQAVTREIEEMNRQLSLFNNRQPRNQTLGPDSHDS